MFGGKSKIKFDQRFDFFLVQILSIARPRDFQKQNTTKTKTKPCKSVFQLVYLFELFELGFSYDKFSLPFLNYSYHVFKK